jgi:hypothetical protein
LTLSCEPTGFTPATQRISKRIDILINFINTWSGNKSFY